MAAVRTSFQLSSTLAEQKTNLELLITSITNRINTVSQELTDMDRWTVEESLNPIQRALKSDQKVLKVSHKITTGITALTTNRAAVLHIDAYSSNFSGIKINQLREDRLPADLINMYVVTFINKTGSRDYYFIKQDPELVKAITDLRELASAMNIAEYTLTKGIINACRDMTMPLAAWGEIDWENKETHGLYYDKVNDPLVIEQFERQLLNLQKESKSAEDIVVLDMGGGKGRLADKIIKCALEKDQAIRYILVEPSEAQILLAHAKLDHYIANPKCKIEIVRSTLDDFTPTVKAHCVISSGGVINMNVVTREQAIENIKKLSNLLLPHGFLIATGQTGIIIKAKHFKAADLNVLSYAVPCPPTEGNKFLEFSKVKAGFFGHYQRYVCQKNSTSEQPELVSSTAITKKSNFTTNLLRNSLYAVALSAAAVCIIKSMSNSK